jgi:predicted RNA-binding protein YlxR (DUF448 family)
MTTLTHPVRTCVGCRSRKEQQLLTRYVPNEMGQPVVSRTASGRGAWMCAESASCFEAAMKMRAFDRAWKTRSSEKKTINGRHLTRVAQP